ncbi:efflux RND transporter permease subunit [Rehaibacterium terrae]|uniref:Cu(I)/Ag(I) efflux system membrane protein CusA/SilA n=1 Tax=Rehaibacterium terrae TaxID=1341696 RepID=A0A7W7XYV1_9GAMM|nr:CusA/CzcA family heavy metal efflux RND transporter [Rehaibacterium terrae]MBB5014969.1 Cu(I)/Ag(I) efflux system membrane protein CusA/SilA [Rehaibacterium terrae]
MLDRLIVWSINHVLLVLMATVLVVGAGIWAVSRTPLDAIPDLSDIQVIVYTELPGQAPQVVEDQVTYPLATAMLAVPKAKAVRGFSFFGASYVYVIFEDGTDLYWARSRVLEYLGGVAGRLPAGANPGLGPDATSVGWVYQYVLRSDRHDLDELRAIQDWYLRYQLTATEGVAEVATVGGFVRQYQVAVDPQRLQAYGLTAGDVAGVVRESNIDVGGRSLELTETEYMIRGRGYLRGIEDIELLVVKAVGGVPVLVRDVARVELVADERRGLADYNGEGEAVGGIVTARYGANALEVIHNVKRRLDEIAPGLPEGVRIEAVYDRSALIHRAIDNLTVKLVQEFIVVALVCLLFLLHVRSALVAILMLPIGVLMAFIAMRWLGVGANIMSLGGIAIAIGAMVDAAIVMVENAHKHMERDAGRKPRRQIILDACREVGPALFFSLLIITVSFLPVFALEGQEGRLFAPLAWTKTLAMAAAALLSVTLVPVLMLLFVRGRVVSESANPVNRLLIRAYRPLIDVVLRFPRAVIGLSLAALALTLVPAGRLGSEFMPTLDEGTLFYMPVTLPGLSVTKAGELLQLQNRLIRTVPEVESVFGKAGRANTATDPAPMEMFETVVNLKPRDQWRPGMTPERLIEELDRAVSLPGLSNAWTMPIKARIDMLSTGIRTPIGIKVFGPDLDGIERLARQVEAAVRSVPGTTSVFAERVTGGYYLTIEPDRLALARHGVPVGALQETIATALGGERVTTTVEGRERYGVIIRYPRELRDDPDKIARLVLVPAAGDRLIPLGQLAEVRIEQGPPMIRTENALLSTYIYVDMRGRDIGGYVADAQRTVREQVTFEPGHYLAWSGQFEYMERAKARLAVLVPLTLLLIFVLLYMNFGRLAETLIVMLSVPFALIGGIWLIWALDYHLSVAVAVGFIALAGVAAETGVVMLIYLDHALRDTIARCRDDGRAPTLADLHAAIVHGAVERLRPKMMTALTIIVGLLPIMWGTGTGSDVMRRIAAPMIGGMVSSLALILLVIPAIYLLVKRRGFRSEQANG